MVDVHRTAQGGHRSANSEEGTTLVELLVVVTILAIVGSITTIGVVRGFNAQLDATNVAETLDGTRIATQRVRDFVRGANEVCASSTADSLVLWTDDDQDGAVTDGELDIFELETDIVTGEEVFQRRVPTASGDTIQLIRDDIINLAVFTYDTPPSDQPDDLACTDGVTPTNGPNAIRVVDVQFTVENPDPAKPPLTTETQVRLRNAELVEGPTNETPTAAFTFDCPDADRECDFDASTSDDPDGNIVSWDWTFTDLSGTDVGTATGEDPSFTFPVGDVDYEVTLLVTDDGGATDDIVQIVRPVEPGSNVPPTADFSFSCTGLQCTFNAQPGVLSKDSDGSIVSYVWDWGTSPASGGTGSLATKTFPASATYAVTLTVTDDDGAVATKTKSVTASTQTIYVSSLTGNKAANGKSITFSVQLLRTVGGDPGPGIVVTVDVDPADQGVRQGSCTTGATGSCSFTISGLNKNTSYPTLASVASVTNTGPYVYDEDQNTDDTETVN